MSAQITVPMANSNAVLVPSVQPGEQRDRLQGLDLEADRVQVVPEPADHTRRQLAILSGSKQA